MSASRFTEHELTGAVGTQLVYFLTSNLSG